MAQKLRMDHVRVLTIDDSAYNRMTIAEVLESSGEITVVGRAANGEEGLRQAFSLKPDVITLDLEMPKMDGFTFLRILMSRQPTPVIVISSYARKQNVFKALELGAVDFIAKPSRNISANLGSIRDELVAKVLMVRQLRIGSVLPRILETAASPEPAGEVPPKEAAFQVSEMGLVVIGASTGGPPALQNIFQNLSRHLPLAFMVAQHMPENFTKAFADRLNRYTSLRVKEAEGCEVLEPGRVYIAPGGKNLKVAKSGKALVVQVQKAEQGTKYVPSIDELFRSAADAMGEKVMAILLTGMGSDGKDGIAAVKDGGGVTLAESQETAVIFGMPKEAIDTGKVDMVIRLDKIPSKVQRFALDMIEGSKGKSER
jgi:two-component system, chemotaxis family, protein-glutamate methylesterase/glutaminase